MGEAAIEAEGLVRTFGKVRALAGVDLQVGEGSVVGLLGPNGAGKTTTIRILSTLLRPDEGRAMVGGYDVARQPGAVRELIGLTGQYAAVDEKLSGQDNLVMIGRLLGLKKQDAKTRATDLLATFGLSDATTKTAKTYSGGMRRRLDLAASLVGRPPFLYLDEPTTGLDPRSRHQMWGMIDGLARQGTTVLLTTQYLDEADRLADRIVVIDHGAVIADGTSNELKARTGGQVIEARPLEDEDLDAVAAILGDVAGAEPTLDRETSLVTAAVSDPGLLQVVSRRFDEGGITVAELALRRPSLDEVFFSLTGHPAEPGDEDGTSEPGEGREGTR